MVVIKEVKRDLKTCKKQALLFIACVVLGGVSVLVCVPLELIMFLCILMLAAIARAYKQYDIPVAVYAFVCTVAAFRELFVVLSGRVPCGLCKFSSVCVDGVEGHSSKDCLRWKTEDEECWEFTKTMDHSLLWAALPALLGTTLCMLRQLARFHASTLEVWCKSRVMIIVMLPTTYAICGFYSLRLLTVNRYDLWTPKAIFDISDLYCAVGLLAFKYLVVDCSAKAVRDASDTFFGLKVSQRGGAAQGDHNVLKPLVSISRQLMELGLYPYVFICFAGNFAEIVMKEAINWWRPDWCMDLIPSLVEAIFPGLKGGHVLPPKTFVAFAGHGGSYACSDTWGAVSPSFLAMNFMVCSIAVTCLLLYEQAMGEVLHDMKPLMKFWCVKGLLLINFYQGIILPFAFPADELTQERVYSLLVCWEAFFLSIFHDCCYKIADFEVLASIPEEKASAAGNPAIRALPSMSPMGSLLRSMDTPPTSQQPLLSKVAEEEGPGEAGFGSGCMLL